MGGEQEDQEAPLRCIPRNHCVVLCTKHLELFQAERSLVHDQVDDANPSAWLGQ